MTTPPNRHVVNHANEWKSCRSCQQENASVLFEGAVSMVVRLDERYM